MIQRVYYQDLVNLVDEDVRAYQVILDNVIGFGDHCKTFDCHKCDHFPICDRIFKMCLIYEEIYKK